MRRVVIVPDSCKRWPSLAGLELAGMRWPLGPAEQTPDVRRIGDLGPEDHVIAYPSTALWRSALAGHPGVRARVSVVLAEPAALQRGHRRAGRLLHRRFHRVFTYDPALLAALPNARDQHPCICWTPEAVDAPAPVKSRNLSIIASAKRRLPGHKLRHRVIARLRAEGVGLGVYGRGYRPIERKAEGLLPYRFTYAIENCRERRYFSEKLIDAFVCRTVPIYWGDPEIARIFDPAGMVICESLEELVAAGHRLGPEDYERMRPALEHNRAIAVARFLDAERDMAEALLAEG
ncbi:MAG: hypothetical protein D6832_00410 [Alphaproteobacteria bacterium]|nr:MAG: hypothetical protein D6832_00410 [Alphaproteobacteria bacterium]